MPEEDKQPWLSIITVVKDDPTGFDRTRESILNQSDGDYEWIVIDSSHEPLAKPENTVYTWVEPKGIYPAMNLGIKHSTGKFVYFLNAGDTFAGPNSLSEVLLSLTDECDVLVGEVVFVNEKGKK